ncbi:hypothetical protein PV721_37025 [Streptomyces sp. MB09-01]|uniref:hypothetical protein n=1 Tax=Streptomyces sp. MB09-01 TaxID=3028666 RepID=UPI0029A60618|nr:hypothetical protein [Streptomyces sp. MB09-01]MDX3539826.1 hypothetical protein [Streptomyces sp. MB09-01]
MLETYLEDVGDPETDAVTAALAEARRRLAQGRPAALDPATARERAAEAGARHPEGPERAHALARIAVSCVGVQWVPWLPEAAGDPGTPPDLRPVSAPGADAPARGNARLEGLSGVRRWFTSATPASVPPCRGERALAVGGSKPRRHWEHPGIGRRDAVLHGDGVVLPLPELTAVALS